MADLGNSSVFSQTDASNGSGTMPSWLGSAAPSTLDDAGRALQGAVTREWNWRNVTVTATGTANAKVLTYSVAPAAYYNGQTFAFIANTTNTTTTTLNVNSLGVKNIKKLVDGVATNLAAGDMVSGNIYEVVYNTSGSCFYLKTELPAILATSNTFTARQYLNSGFQSQKDSGTSANYIWTGGGGDGALIFVGSTGTVAAPGNVSASQQVGYVDFRGYYGSDISLARIAAIVDGTPGATDMPGALIFYTTPDGTDTIQERLRINNAGLITTTGSFTASSTGAISTSGSGDVKTTGSGNVVATGTGKIGYGTGAGGSYTQLTSKTTAVAATTLTGRITMNAANLAAGVSVVFQVTLTSIDNTDVVVCHGSYIGGVNPSNYLVQTLYTQNNIFWVRVTNISAGALAEALVINYAVIKGVVS